MWLWLRATCVPFYDSYWTDRGIQEFERIFRRLPFSTVPPNQYPNPAQLGTLISAKMEEAITHFGEGLLNPSTVAWILWCAEQEHAASQASASESLFC